MRAEADLALLGLSDVDEADDGSGDEVAPSRVVGEVEHAESATVISIQPPGTTTMGLSMLRAYQATGDETCMKAARDAGVKRVVLTSSYAAIGYGQGWAGLRASQSLSFATTEYRSVFLRAGSGRLSTAPGAVPDKSPIL